MWGDIEKLGIWQGEIWNRRRDGKDYLEWLTVKVLRDSDGNVSHYIGTFTDQSCSVLNSSLIRESIRR